MTKLLGFSQIGLTLPDRLFRNLTFRDVHDRADNLFVARLVPNGMRKIMKMLYRTIRHQQPMLPVELMSAPRCTPKNVCERAHIVRMRSLQYQIGRWFCPGSVPVNPSRFIRPEYPLGTYFYSDTAGSTQSLRICQMCLAPPKFEFGQLSSGDIHYRADDLDCAGFASLRFSDNVQVFDPRVWHQETKLNVDSFSPVTSGDRHVHRRHIQRVDALQNRWQ